MAFTTGMDDDGGGFVVAINTTPLVDVMLVLLIVFLITIPVAIHTVPVRLPRESSAPNVAGQSNVTLAVDMDGRVFWNEAPVSDDERLLRMLEAAAARIPQPEFHIRGDERGRYEFVGRVVTACQRAGIVKLSFVTEPERNP